MRAGLTVERREGAARLQPGGRAPSQGARADPIARVAQRGLANPWRSPGAPFLLVGGRKREAGRGRTRRRPNNTGAGARLSLPRKRGRDRRLRLSRARASAQQTLLCARSTPAAPPCPIVAPGTKGEEGKRGGGHGGAGRTQPRHRASGQRGVVYAQAEGEPVVFPRPARHGAGARERRFGLSARLRRLRHLDPQADGGCHQRRRLRVVAGRQPAGAGAPRQGDRGGRARHRLDQWRFRPRPRATASTIPTAM